MNIGEKLYELRKKKNLSQEEIADKLNVTRQTISKWETNQSMPDLDKIVPLCDLYEISTDMLLKGTEEKQQVLTQYPSTRKEKAKTISISVFLYFLSIIWVVISEAIDGINENIQVGVFLFICAFATTYLIYKCMSFPKEKMEKIPKKYKAINEMVSIIFLLIYLIISFITHAWEITWMIWLIYALVIQIIHSILTLKEGYHGE